LLQIHCHEHAVLDHKAEKRVLQRMGLQARAMPAWCCGMAGSFGFEAGKYEWSRKIAEHALLPQLRTAPDAMVVVNGFSCREQIEQLSGRETKHIADLLAEAIGFSTYRSRPALPAISDVLLAGGVAAGACFWELSRRKPGATVEGITVPQCVRPTKKRRRSGRQTGWRRK
jgi:hypothetical protein